MAAGAKHLIDYGLRSAALWVLAENNKAYTFYNSLGAKFIGSHKEEAYGAIIHDIALGWDDVEALL